jgi:hypothetical protein
VPPTFVFTPEKIFVFVSIQTMESSLTESVQQLVRPGKCVDLYYPDPETAKKQCFRTTQNTRYVQQFANLTGGSSVFTIPPNNGVQDIVLTMELPASGVAGFVANGLAIPRGWGYALIKQVSFRYGGSSQYFLSGQQLLQASLRKTPNSGARDQLLALGGSAAAGAAAAPGDFSVAQRAYVWLALPHTMPSADGKLPPLPTDLLTQQVQITVELNPIASIFSAALGATGTPASTLSFAEFQVQQICFENQGDALARRVDMTSHALSYPIEFTQQEAVIPLANAVGQSLSLTGFRSGEVRNIQCWITDTADLTSAVKNPFKWYAPEDMVMTYAGEVYARFDKGSGALWNLVNGVQDPAVNEIAVADAGGGVCSITTPFLGRWMELPFAQTIEDKTAHTTYTAGKPITNGIVNLTFNLPVGLAPSATLVLHVSYVYNGVLTFSAGTCDYVI